MSVALTNRVIFPPPGEHLLLRIAPRRGADAEPNFASQTARRSFGDIGYRIQTSKHPANFGKNGGCAGRQRGALPASFEQGHTQFVL